MLLSPLKLRRKSQSTLPPRMSNRRGTRLTVLHGILTPLKTSNDLALAQFVSTLYSVDPTYLRMNLRRRRSHERVVVRPRPGSDVGDLVPVVGGAVLLCNLTDKSQVLAVSRKTTLAAERTEVQMFASIACFGARPGGAKPGGRLMGGPARERKKQHNANNQSGRKPCEQMD